MYKNKCELAIKGNLIFKMLLSSFICIYIYYKSVLYFLSLILYKLGKRIIIINIFDFGFAEW